MISFPKASENMPNPNKVTERLFQSPSKYIQGPYAIQNAAKYLSQLGNAPLLICDDIVWKIGTYTYTTPPPRLLTGPLHPRTPIRI